jgi:hypothetical protein
MCRSDQLFPSASCGLSHYNQVGRTTIELLPYGKCMLVLDTIFELQDIVNIYFDFIFVSFIYRYCVLNKMVEKVCHK